MPQKIKVPVPASRSRPEWVTSLALCDSRLSVNVRHAPLATRYCGSAIRHSGRFSDIGCANCSPIVAMRRIFLLEVQRNGRGAWSVACTGNTAEVFERGSRVMKLLEITRGTIRSIARGGDGRSCGGSRVWNVRDIGGRWGLVFDRVAQTSFAEHMLGKMKDVCRYLECMVQLHTRIHSYQQSNLRGSRSHLQPTLQRACISTSRASENATTQSWICRTATNYVTVTSTR